MAACGIDTFARGVGAIPDAVAPVTLALEALAIVLAACAKNVVPEGRTFGWHAKVGAIVIVEIVAIVAGLVGINYTITAEGTVLSANCAVAKICARGITRFIELWIKNAIAAA